MEDYGVVPENINFGVKISVFKDLLEAQGILI